VLSAILVAGATTMLSLFGVTPAFADDLQSGQSAVVTGTEGRGLKVRAGPGMSHAILTTLNEGSSVQVAAGPVSDGDEVPAQPECHEDRLGDRALSDGRYGGQVDVGGRQRPAGLPGQGDGLL
jgi:hypothetical protein